jgi:hypothetical protein
MGPTVDVSLETSTGRSSVRFENYFTSDCDMGGGRDD